MVNATMVRPARKVTKVYDLSQFPQPEVGEIREAAGILRVKGIAIERQFRIGDAEVDLDAVEAKAKEIAASANGMLELIAKIRRS